MDNVDSHTRILSLCSGVGGLDLGLRLALKNARTICYLENGAYPLAILASRIRDALLDDAPIWDDIRTFDSKPWRGAVDCIVGGYPCQPFSVAGEKRGIDDPRYIFPDIARIIGDIQPTFCFFENVSNHLKCGFEEVRTILRELGYEVEVDLRDAEEVGGTHKRQRLFILAYNHSKLRRSDRLLEVFRTCGKWSPSNIEGAGSPPMATTLFPPPIYGDWDSVSDGLKPALPRMDDESATRVDRVAACGNGVLPLVAAYALKTLTAQVLRTL